MTLVSIACFTLLLSLSSHPAVSVSSQLSTLRARHAAVVSTWRETLGHRRPGPAHSVERLGGERRVRHLPEGSILGAYASADGGADKCAERVTRAVVDGVNVVFWFGMGMDVNETTGKPQFTTGFNKECFVRVYSNLAAAGIAGTTHMITYGGWNSPRWPRTGHSGEEWFAAWEDWNRGVVQELQLTIGGGPEDGLRDFDGFDGLDWDMEGNDDVASERNDLDLSTLDLFGALSVAMKRGGYLVTMVPPVRF